MEKLKKWLEPTKNKVIASIIAVLILGAGGFGVWSLSKPNAEEPVIVFKDNLVFEYGDKLEQDKLLDIIIDKEKSKYDVVVKVDEIDTASVTIKTPSNEVDEVIKEKAKPQTDKRKGTITVKLGDIEKSFEFEYDVHDTQAPEFSKVESIDTAYNIEPNYKEIIKAIDPVDGELEVTIESDVDYEKTGSYEIKASATDKNGNKTTISVIVNVQEEVKVEETPPSTQPDTSGGSGDVISTTPTEPTPVEQAPSQPAMPSQPTPDPVEPEKPSNPAPDGMILYKDYGTFNGCSAVINELTENNWRTWLDSLCTDDGKLFYRPAN